MTFITYIYASFIKPEVVLKDRNTKYAICVYLLSMLCFTLSTTLISTTRSSIWSIIFLFFSMVVYFSITSIIYVSILHFIVSLFYKYKPRHSLKTFLTDVFFIHKTFIMLLPLSLSLSILPTNLYRIFFVVVFLFLYVYYIYSFSKVININIKLDSKSQAIFLLVIVYVILNVVGLMLSISNISILVNILLSFIS